MTTATWVSIDQELGSSTPGQSADSVTTSQAGTAYGPPIAVGTLRRFKDMTGLYGSGTFIYLPGVASLAAGDVVTYSLPAGVSDATDATVARWTGTAGSGDAIAVATTANTSATQFSWYQVQGAAIVNTSGTVAAGDKAYWQATATVSSTAISGKQIQGMKATSANGVPSANKAIYQLDFPTVETANNMGVASGITAGTTRTQGGATALSLGLNRVDTSTAPAAGSILGDGVVLPAASAGAQVTIINNTNNPIQVYGNGSDTINGVAGATGIVQPPNSVDIYWAAATGTWQVDAGVGYAGQLNTVTALDAITAAGANQGAATVLTADFNRVTTASAGQGVRLPASAPGMDVIVQNHSGVPIIVYGGGTDKIDDIATASGVQQMDSSVVLYTCYAAGNWYSNGLATGYAKNPQGTSALETVQPGDAITAAGTTQGTATQLTAAINTVSTVASGTGVNLPANSAGLAITVINAGANNLLVYPAQGATDTINGIAATLGVAMLPSTIGVFNSTAAGAWTFTPSSTVADAFTTNSATSGTTLTAANISGGSSSVTLSLTGTLGGAANAQLPTVAALQLALHGASANTSYRLRIVNNSAANFNWTVTTNTGWTLTGDMIVPQGMWADYNVKFTTLSAATLQFLSMGPVTSLPPAKFVTSAAATAAAGDLTGAGVCHFIASGANATYTTRTAAQMFGDIPGCYIGYSWTLVFRNTNASANTLTAVDGSVTLTGTATAAQNTTRTWVCTFTTASAVTFQSMGIGASAA